MSQYITHIAVSRHQAQEQQLQAQGFLMINVVLNKDDHGNPAFLWYKKESDVPSITRFQVSFDEPSTLGLINAGYTKVETKLTPDGSTFLWYIRGKTSFDTPIVKLEVSTNADDEAEKLRLGWERAGCNLSAMSGKWVYLWVKREKQTFICDVYATNSNGSDEDLFNKGYIRIDQSTNTEYVCPCYIGIDSSNFLWYRQSTEAQEALTDLKISINRSQHQQYQQQKYSPVSVNLNEGTGGNAVYLWYKKEKGQAQVEWMLLLLNENAIEPYIKAGINIIKKNINDGNDEDDPRYLCFQKNY